MTFSLAPAGSPAVPRVAATWVRGTAVPALTIAIADVSAARERARSELVGVSGNAYALHTHTLLGHLTGLRGRLLAASALFQSYADRLAAHESLLASVRARAHDAGLEVVGDTVLPPTGVIDSAVWSDLASTVLAEHRSLADWVASHLDAAVPTYSDRSLSDWVTAFLDGNRVSLAAAGLQTTFAQGSAALTAGRLLESATRMDRLAKVPGPAGTVVQTVLALESDDPAEGVAGVVGGVAAAAAVTAVAAAAVPAAPVVVVGGAVVLVGAGATWLTTKAWEQLPEDFRDTADEVVGESWDGVKDTVSDAWDSAGDLADDLVDDLGAGLVGWAR